MSPKKDSLHRRDNQPAQTDCGSEELAFLDSLSGAVVGTGTAADTNIGIDDVLVFALGNSLNGAVVSTSATLDASVSDIVSHDITSIMFCCRLTGRRISILTRSTENAILFSNPAV